MPELDYKSFSQQLKTFEKKELLPVYLFWGEEFLYKTALEEFLDAVLSASERRLNADAVDDAHESIHDIIERIHTYSLLSGPKVVVLKDSKVFYSSLDASAFFEKARSAYDVNDMKKASRHILSLMGKLKLAYEDLADKTDRNERLKYDAAVFGDDLWLGKIIDYCADNRLQIPPALDNADLLQQAIEKGFPAGNHLVVTTDMVDKRRALYKSILKIGAVINCSVPKGERRADKAAQTTVLNEQLRTILARTGKTIKKEASDSLVEMTGFDLRTFAGNIEKLVSYVGDRTEISADDVQAVLERTKKDPLYELTNSVAERNLQQAIFFLDSLLSDNFHPLQILAAIANHVRRLLVIRDFLESSRGASWQGPKTNYQRFQSSVMPAMQAYDAEMLAGIDGGSERALDADPDEGETLSDRKLKIKTDLAIVKNPQNPYPIFQMTQRAQGFGLNELQVAVEALSEADLQLKSSVKNPCLILENVILGICRRTDK
ncbi:MAG: DNA polymerase III subunit delta [Thermodesulfobacteriota bacterium]